MITWDETKRRKNLQQHGIDLAELESVFDYPMYSTEDRSAHYDELRQRSICWFKGRVVVLIWVDRYDGARLISCRNGEKHETRDYYKKFLAKR